MEYPDTIEISRALRPVDCTIRLPGSKSLTNRALLLAALANGDSEIRGALLADDTRLMADALTALGIELTHDVRQGVLHVHGCAGRFPNGEADLYCGSAGTVLRFLTAACATSQGEYRLDGSARLRERPLGELVTLLRELGAKISCEQAEGHCPLTVSGRGLRGGTVRCDRLVSSQFLSAVLMAAPYATNDVMIELNSRPPSAPYVSMTLNLMEKFGVSTVESRMQHFIVPAMQGYQSTNYEVEPDATAASYFFAAAALTGGRITIEGLDAESSQGDVGFVDVLEKMGCTIGRDKGKLSVHGPERGALQGIDVDLSDMPDVAQTLAVLAVFAESPTTIRNVGSLRIKETDRINALSFELQRLGAEAETGRDWLKITPAKTPTGAAIDTYDDHRMAMSFSLAGLRIEGVVIRDPGCVAKTFPDFFERWSQLTV